MANYHKQQSALAGGVDQSPEWIADNGLNAIYETIPRKLACIPGIVATKTITGGVEHLFSVMLPAGKAISTLGFQWGTTALTRGATAGTAHLYYVLRSKTLGLLAYSDDEGDAIAISASQAKEKTLTKDSSGAALGGSYTTLTQDEYYIGFMVQPGTGGGQVNPTIYGLAIASLFNTAIVTGQLQIAGTNGSSLTYPPGSSASPLAVYSNAVYGWAR